MLPYLHQTTTTYPAPLSRYLADQAPATLTAWGKPVYTFQHEATAHLVRLGAAPVGIGELVERLDIASGKVQDTGTS